MTPLSMKEKVIEETHLWIIEMKRVSKPRAFITFKRKFHSTLSKTLLMSNLSDIRPSLPQVWCSSYETKTLSIISLPGMKADWDSEMISGKRDLILLARTFEASL